MDADELKALQAPLGVELRDARITAEGDLHFRGTLGVARDALVGFGAIRLRFELDTPATEEQRQTLVRPTERYGVVLQTLPDAAARRGRHCRGLSGAHR